MKIKDLPETINMSNVRFKHPTTGKYVFWISQWSYPPPEGKAGVWYKEKLSDTAMHPIFLDDLKEALEWEVAE